MAFQILCITISASFILYLLHLRYHAGMNRFPGPFLASFTDLWKVWYTFQNGSRPIYVDLHERYGDIVRVGPNELSFADPRAIDEIYGPKGMNQKAKEYAVLATTAGGEGNEVLFSGLDTQWHDRQRQLVAPAFSISQMIKYEPCIDENISLFIAQLRRRFASREDVMNFNEWATYWSLDIIHDLTFGERIGCIEQGKDIHDTISGARKLAFWFLYFSRAPILDYLRYKNPVILWLNQHGWFESPNTFLPLIKRQFVDRQQYWKKVQTLKTGSGDPPTFTEAFIRVRQNHADATDFEPYMHSMNNITAGTEAVAITISAVFTHILTHPPSYSKLQTELSTLPRPPISFEKAKSLPYLNAVIHESMRLHIADKFSRAREVPAEGMEICDTFIPGGVNVSILPDIAHRLPAIFGKDVHLFRPERWLESDEEKTARMLASLLSFGKGRFGCVAQNLARVEVVKFVCCVLRDFDFELVNFDKEKEGRVVNGMFPYPVDLMVRLRERR